MAATGGMVQATRVAGAPRWRALVLTAVLVGSLWGIWFATSRIAAPRAPVSVRQSSVEPIPGFIRPGKDRGQVRFGPVSEAEVPVRIRPGHHGGDDVKGG